MPFLAGPQRLAARAVNGAVLAFIGAQRRPLTEEAGGLGAGFGQEGQGSLNPAGNGCSLGEESIRTGSYGVPFFRSSMGSRLRGPDPR